MQIPRYRTLAERPIFSKIAIASVGSGLTAVVGLDAHILSGIVGHEALTGNQDPADLYWETINGSKVTPEGPMYLVNMSSDDVKTKIQDALGTFEVVDTLAVFKDWN